MKQTPKAAVVQERTCAGCQQKRSRSELVRFVLDPNGEVCLDFTGRLPGRGAWSCPTQTCFAAIEKRRAMKRAFKSNVDFNAQAAWTDLKFACERYLINTIGLSNKAGWTVYGTDEVKRMLLKESLDYLILADDASDRSVRTFANLCEMTGTPYLKALSKAQWGHIFDRAETAVIGIGNPEIVRKLNRCRVILSANEKTDNVTKKEVVNE